MTTIALPTSPAARSLLSGIKFPKALTEFLDYVKGNKIAKLPSGIIHRDLDPTLESATLLRNQNLLKKLTFGLSERPNFHVQDRVVGGIGGATVTGLSDNYLREHDGSTKDRLLRLASVMAGGYGGGKALNELGNVGRRYLANTSNLYGYAAQPTPTLKGLWEHGVKSKVTSREPEFRKIYEHEISKMINKDQGHGVQQNFYSAVTRDELLRRYLGIHKPNAKTDYFVKNPDGSLRYNPNVVRPGTEAFTTLVKRPLERQLNDFEYPSRYSQDSAEYNPFNLVFGSHDMVRTAPMKEMSREYSRRAVRKATGKVPKNPNTRAYRTSYKINDAWNFAHDPHEGDIKHYLLGLLKTSPQRWKEFLAQPPTLTHHSFVPVGGAENIGDRLKSWGQRQILETLFRQNTPVIYQNLDVEYVPRHMLNRRRDVLTKVKLGKPDS